MNQWMDGWMEREAEEKLGVRGERQKMEGEEEEKSTRKRERNGRMETAAVTGMKETWNTQHITNNHREHIERWEREREWKDFSKGGWFENRGKNWREEKNVFQRGGEEEKSLNLLMMKMTMMSTRKESSSLSPSPLLIIINIIILHEKREEGKREIDGESFHLLSQHLSTLYLFLLFVLLHLHSSLSPLDPSLLLLLLSSFLLHSYLLRAENDERKKSEERMKSVCLWLSSPLIYYISYWRCSPYSVPLSSPFPPFALFMHLSHIHTHTHIIYIKLMKWIKRVDRERHPFSFSYFPFFLFIPSLSLSFLALFIFFVWHTSNVLREREEWKWFECRSFLSLFILL